MFENYKEDVLKYFNEKKEKQELFNLENLTRAKLRKECLVVFARKYQKVKDDDILRSFFDPTNRFNDHVKGIEKFDLDKFRPLISFLKNGTNIREESAVKLLAWLIDYKTYEDWKIENYRKNAIEKANTIPKTAKEEIAFIPDNLIQTGVKDQIKKAKPKLFKPIFIWLLSIVSLAIVVGAFLFLQNKYNSNAIALNEKCMFWNGERYEAIACDLNPDTFKIPLNLQTLNSLKRITKPDTLTSFSLGKIWYGKTNGKINFYTNDGINPLDTNKRLKPLSNYILAKYVSYPSYQLKLFTWFIGGFIASGLLILLIYKKIAK